MNEVIYENLLLEFYNQYKSGNMKKFISELVEETNNFENCSDELFEALETLLYTDHSLTESEMSDDELEFLELQESVADIITEGNLINALRAHAFVAKTNKITRANKGYGTRQLKSDGTRYANKKEYLQDRSDEFRGAKVTNKTNFINYLNNRKKIRADRVDEKNKSKEDIEKAKEDIKTAKVLGDGNETTAAYKRLRQLKKETKQINPNFKKRMADTRKNLMQNAVYVDINNKKYTKQDVDDSQKAEAAANAEKNKQATQLVKSVTVPNVEKKPNNDNKTTDSSEKNNITEKYDLYNVLVINGFIPSNRNLIDLKEGLETGKYVILDSSNSIITESMDNYCVSIQLLENNGYGASKNNIEILEKMLKNNLILFR